MAWRSNSTKGEVTTIRAKGFARWGPFTILSVTLHMHHRHHQQKNRRVSQSDPAMHPLLSIVSAPAAGLWERVYPNPRGFGTSVFLRSADLT